MTSVKSLSIQQTKLKEQIWVVCGPAQRLVDVSSQIDNFLVVPGNLNASLEHLNDCKLIMSLILINCVSVILKKSLLICSYVCID